MSRLRRPFRKGSKGYLLQNRKGTTLRQDLGKGASDIRRAFKNIKNAGKSLTRGTTDLSATRVLQGPAAGSDLIVAANKLSQKTNNNKKQIIDNMTGYEKAVYMQNEGKEEKDKREKEWRDRRPQINDYKTRGKRNLTVAQRGQYKRDLEAWEAEKPK